MFPFDPGPTDVPYPPVDLPTPDIPNASFKDVGAGFAAGVQAAGGLGSGPKTWLDWIAQIVGKIVASLLGLVESIVAWLLAFMLKIFNGSDSGTNAIISVVLTNMFGVPISGSAVGGNTDAIVKAILESLGVSATGVSRSGSATGPGGGGIGPSLDGANKFLNTVLHMAVENWVLGVLGEVASLGAIKTIGELKDGIARVMGIGRLAHQALSPAVKILIHDPFLYALNQTYLPSLLGPEILVREFTRGALDANGLNTLMAYHGYSQDQTNALINISKVHLGPSQLWDLVVHKTMTQSEATAALQAQGYDAATAASALDVAASAKIDPLLHQHAALLVEGYAQRKLPAGDFQSLLTEIGLDDATSSAYLAIAADKLALNTTRISIGEGMTLVKKGLWGGDQLQDLANYHGLLPGDAIDLELLALTESAEEAVAQKAKQDRAAAQAKAAIAKQQADANKAAAAAAEAQFKGVSTAAYETLVLDGLRTTSDYAAYLSAKGVTADNVAALVQALNLKLQKQGAAAGVSPSGPAQQASKHLSLADLERALKAGEFDLSEFTSRVEDLGYSAADAQILADLNAQKATLQVARAAAVSAIAAPTPGKSVSLAELKMGVRLGLAPMADYTAALQAAGYDDAAVGLLEGELQAQITADQAAAAAKGATAGAGGTKGLSLSELARAVRGGVASIGEYQAAAAAAGYGAAAQQQLVGLLQLQIDADQATAAAKGKVTGAAGARALSLAQLERLLKLGLKPAADYTAALIDTGLSASDAQLLTIAATAGAQQLSKAGAAVPTVTALLAQHGLSLATLETSARDGLLTLDQFAAQLANAGVSGPDVANLRALVAQEIANQAAAAQLHASAAAAAAAKGLNLGQEEAGVKAGVLTIDDYFAFVGSLGYNDTDANTLTQTLYASKAYQKLLSASASGS